MSFLFVLRIIFLHDDIHYKTKYHNFVLQKKELKMAENQQINTIAEQPAKKILVSNAFSYMFEDKDFWKKALLPIIVIAIANIASLLTPEDKNASWTLLNYIAFAVSIPASLIGYGYVISCAKNVSLNNEIATLNVGKAIILALKGTVAQLAIVLPFIILGGLCGFLSSFLPQPLSYVFLGVVIIAAVILLFLFIYRALALFWIFIHTENLLSFYKLKLAGKLIKQDSSRYSGFFCGSIGYNILIVIGMIIALFPLGFFHKAVSYIFIVAFAVYYVYFNIYLYANCISKECVKMLEE